MGWTLLLLAACGAPDPDALLRKGDLDGAAAAYAERAGAPLDVAHPVAEVLAGRARSDATVTTTTIADAMDAVRFLEQAPIIRVQHLDLDFDRFEDLGAALDALAEGDALFVVGRSEGLGDKDPYLMGGALPWKGGRVVGWARRDMAALGKSVDANPPREAGRRRDPRRDRGGLPERRASRRRVGGALGVRREGGRAAGAGRGRGAGLHGAGPPHPRGRRIRPPMSPKIAHYAVAAGLCAFVPIPLLDAWLERKATRAMFAAIAEDAGRPLDAETLDKLVEDRSSLLLGCLGMMVVWPIKKLFRTVLYFLTLKDVVDGIAAAALRGAMVHRALTSGALDTTGPAGTRSAMDTTLDRWTHSPVSRFVFRGERPPAEWLVREEAGALVDALYRHAGGGPILADFEQRLAQLRDTP